MVFLTSLVTKSVSHVLNYFELYLSILYVFFASDASSLELSCKSLTE